MIGFFNMGSRNVDKSNTYGAIILNFNKALQVVCKTFFKYVLMRYDIYIQGKTNSLYANGA